MSSRSLMHRVFPPSKPPNGGYPPSFRLIVGGTQLSGSWYLSAIVRLQGFSSCSPAASLRRRSPKMVTSSLMVGESEPGCGLCPLPEFGSLPSAIFFAECFISGTRQRALCRVPRKKPLVKENTRRRSSLPSVLFLTLGKKFLCRVSFFDTRQRALCRVFFLQH
jgi:hypothetical protein